MRFLPVFVILLFSFFFFITPPSSFAYSTNWIFYYGSYGGATAGEPYVACDINDRTSCECVTPGPVSVDMQACQDNLGSPQNVCCTGGSCDTGAERCGTIGTWDWCRATSCTAIPVGFEGCGFDFQYNYQSCGATDSCTATSNWPYLNAGQCNTSGCTVGGVYKVCCDSDGTTDGTCVGSNFTGLCPSGSTTVMCGVSASTCSAEALFPCVADTPCEDACRAWFPPPNVVDSAGPLSCSGTSPPSLNASWSGNTENGCNIFVRAGVSDYQINSSCSGNWSGSTLPGGPAVVSGGTYQLFAQDDAGTVDGGQATCPSAPSCTPICPTSPPTGLSPNGTQYPPGTSRVILSWNPVTNADWYDVRVDDGQGGDSSNVVGSGGTPCPGNPGHDVCVNQWSGTSMTVTVQNNRSYTWWVHAGGSDGCSPPANCAQTSASNIATFSTGIPIVVTCPNGSCGAGETCSTCPQDCGTCPTIPTISCSGSPNPAQTNQTVTWTANPSGGVTPYTYSWSGTAITQATNTASPGNVSSFSKSYSGAGAKTATVTLRDALGQTANRDCAVTVQTPGSSGNCTLTANPSSGSPPLTTTITLSPSSIITGVRPADAQLSLNFGDGTTGSFNLNAQATHTYQSAGNYTVLFTATSSQDPNYNYSCTTPIPPPPITVSSLPPPPPPVWSCSYVDPPDNTPTLALDPDGKTLRVSYQYQSSQTPNVSFYRNTQLGFLPGGTLLGNQFGNQGTSFHRNPETSQYLYYQSQASNGIESGVSNTVGVATQPEGEGYSCRPPLFYDLANITGASQASSRDSTMTFKLIYQVGITSLGGAGCSMSEGCKPTYTPPYLRLERSSGGDAYIPWDAARSRTHRCIQQNTGRWWYQRGTCVLSEWTATYAVGLPPGTSDTFTVTGYNDGQCSYKTANGSARFGGGTSGGTPPQIMTPSLSGSVQTNPENRQYVSLSWPQTQDGQQVKVYMAEGWNGRWPATGNPLPQLPKVFDGSNNRWTFTATDDLSQLAPGTYYYGNSLYDRGFCSTVLTDQASFVWTGNGISGTVFVDVDKDGVKDSGETGYSGASVSVAGQGSKTTNASGFYSFSNLASGTYTVTLTPPTGYVATTTNPVTVSTIPTTVDFGIVESVAPWWQTKDGDLWTQADLNSPIPNACVASPSCVEELSLVGAGGYPGVAVYGGTSALFGAGKVSGKEWLAKSGYSGRRYDYAWFTGLAPLEVFTDSRSVITTSEVPGGELVSGYESGGYIWRYRDGDLTVSGTANLNERKVILIVNGKLTLKGRITLDDGRGFFMAIARGDIKVDSGVSHPNQAALEGLFITDGTLSTGTKKPQEDNRLYIRGSIVAWGGVALERDLGEENNGTLAAEYIEYAPDLLFTFPRDLARQGIVWKEVAP